MAHQDHRLVELRVLAQRRRNEHASRAVHVDVDCEADQAPLQFPDARVEVGQSFELLLDQLPVREGVDQQAPVRVGGDDEVPGAALEQRVAMPRRNGEPALNIQI